jgi:hypothetical protein
LENSASNDASILHLDKLEPKILLEETQLGPKTAHSSSSALSAQYKKSDTTKCNHNRIAISCWTCHPEIAPICDFCRGQGLRRFKHKTYSRIFPQQPKSEHENENVAFLALKTSASSIAWILDSGATQHMYHDSNLFSSIVPFHTSITTADGNKMTCKGKGTVEYQFGSTRITLKDTLFCPTLTDNLLSIPVLTKQGFSVIFHDNFCEIKGKKIHSCSKNWQPIRL